MARQEHQKTKILYILKVLSEETDERHSLSAEQIAKRVTAYGVHCERKSVYRDLDELIEFGYDIIRTRQGAYMASRQFELPELKLLVDAVQSSKFITEKKSDELIAKLGTLVSRYEGAQLKRQVFVRGRIKTMNESIYYNIDAIYEGIERNLQISFFYCRWNAQKELEKRRQGMRYRISPWFLRWEDEKYYLIGYDAAQEQMKHFRVDKMLQIQVEQQARLGQQAASEMDMAAYGRQTFGMFQGKQELVTLRVSRELVGVMIDRFGTGVWMYPVDEQSVQVRVEVMVSNQFFGWLAGLGGLAKIEGPAWVETAYRELLAKL